METEKQGIYHVSGLTYDLKKLLLTIGLVLIGYAAYCLCIAVTPTIVNLKLKELGVSSTLMVFITTTISQIFNMTVCQWVSFKSDRYRSKRWGRRVPFILFTLPMVCLSWLILGFYKEESAFIGKLLAPFAELSQTTLAITMVAIGIIMFRFFYMFVGSVFFYIYNDVIPTKVMTRFYGAIQITGTLCTSLYNFFIFKHVIANFREVMILFVIIYAVLMGAMCLFLKEPRFPEPEPEEKKKSKGIAAVFSFGKECFTHKFYWYQFIDTALSGAAVTSMMFVVFHQQSMGLSLEDIGRAGGTASLVRTVLAFLAAALGSTLVDRWHPVRVNVLLRLFIFITVCYETRWFFFSPSPQVYWWSYLLFTLFLFLNLFTGIAGMPYLQMLMPKSRFGQFCSARSLVASCSGLVFGLLLGGYMDVLKYVFNFGDHAYRGVYFWQVFFYGTGIVFCILSFLEYRKLGGYKSFKAPAVWESSGFEKMEITQTLPPSARILKFVIFGFDLTWCIGILSPIVLSYLAQKLNVAGAKTAYLMINLPVAAGIFILWMLLRKKIYSGINTIVRGGTAQIPHHGVLLLALIMRLLFQGIFITESVMSLKLNGSSVGAYLNIYETALDALFIFIIWICMKLEDPTNMEELQNKTA